MYCPTCGSEERQVSQYCRACGTDLRVVRVSLERPDSITASAVSAREQISQAMAEKIRQMEPDDLKRVAEDVLPQIEKFLESPEEKRLRRMRAGVTTAAAGLGVSIAALLLLMVGSYFKDPEVIPWLVLWVGLGVVTFLIGLGLVINGRMLTQPRKELKDSFAEAQAQSHLDAGHTPPLLRSSAEGQQPLRSPTANDLSRTGNSVTEPTTHLLNAD